MDIPAEKPHYGDELPIAAIATAVTVSALAVIRLSGKGTRELLAKIFSRPAALLTAGGNTVVYGWILDAEKRRLDETLVSVYRAPRSYTGEDSADISCHGGISAVRAVFNAVLAAGFREALPGEFTFRAFINGKLDLTRAESVMELVSAKTGAARAHAVTRLEGSLEKTVRAISRGLVSALAEIELHLDYSEIDGIETESDTLPAREAIAAALRNLQTLASGYAYEKLYRDGARIALAGMPNAGKSSLFNCLLREDRAIVTEIPGTTRDWLEAWIAVDGVPVCLIDTAGLRESEDTIESIGIAKSRELLTMADMIIFIVDGSCFTGKETAEIDGIDPQKVLFLWNKADIAPNVRRNQYIPVSAKTGMGIDLLRAAITAKIAEQYQKPGTEGSVTIGSERQKKLLDTACAALRAVLQMADSGEPLDLIAAELWEAVRAAGEITGETTGADILDTLFSQFCVGK